MKKLVIVLLIGCVSSFYSCTNDIVSSEITFTRATPIYEDLNALRTIPLEGAVRDISDPGKVYLSDNLILIGEENQGIHVLDNSNPENPRAVSFIQIPQNKEFYVDGNFIYAESAYDMLKIDISTISSPRLAGRIEHAFGPGIDNDLGQSLIGFTFEEVTETFTSDDVLWNQIFPNDVAYFDYQRQLIPKSAVPSSFIGNSSNAIGTINRIAKAKDHIYAISSQQLTTIEDGSNFGLISNRDIGWAMETIYPQGDNLFIGSQNNMQILDISDPSQPTEQGWFNHATACDPVLPVGSTTYVTLRSDPESNCPGDESALLVINTSDVRTPWQIQEIGMISPFGMTLIGDKLYVGEGANGLKVFDATDREFLTEISFDTSVQAYDIIAHPTNNNLILVSGPEGYGQYEVDGETDSYSLVSWISN
jgi:hypothetical protein